MYMIQKIKLRLFVVILGVIVAVSFVLRIWGNDFGLPYEYHVDEVQYVRQAASMGESGIEPTMWNNPPFFKYILLLEYGTLYAFGRILGLYSSAADYGNLYFFNPTTLYMLARGTNAIFGSITVLLIGIIGRDTFNDRVGLISAWFLATCFLHVRDAHFAVNDMSATFFILVVLFSSLKILLHGERKWYILAGVGLGFGFATKYTVVLSVAPIIFCSFSFQTCRF
ncbi:MAG: phospholipid carrier-dependent glycosyltransferase [Anaerolineae bacterium]|nr:phospholipid carrier-dependent glycosyltransferase [Anaerolineae bacterium]